MSCKSADRFAPGTVFSSEFAEAYQRREMLAKHRNRTVERRPPKGGVQEGADGHRPR